MTIFEYFSYTLLAWYKNHGRKGLPWLIQKNPYKTWISEIMLQQTQVQTVITYFNRFIERFPNVEELAQSSEEEVLSLWSGLGYYSRARNLYETAKIIAKKYHGNFPNECHLLTELPGIGQTTAAAILSLAFNQATPILDANVKRVLARFFLISGDPGQSQFIKKLWELAHLCMDKIQCSNYTQAIMDFGALCCKPKNPNCLACPLQEGCLAFKSQEQNKYPNPKKRKIRPTVFQQFLVLKKETGFIYLEKRPPKGIWGGLWCLPAIDINLCPLAFIEREYRLRGEISTPILQFTHHFTHFHLNIQAISIEINGDKNSSTTGIDGWFSLDQRTQIGMAKATQRILNHVY